MAHPEAWRADCGCPGCVCPAPFQTLGCTGHTHTHTPPTVDINTSKHKLLLTGYPKHEDPGVNGVTQRRFQYKPRQRHSE